MQQALLACTFQIAVSQLWNLIRQVIDCTCPSSWRATDRQVSQAQTPLVQLQRRQSRTGRGRAGRGRATPAFDPIASHKTKSLVSTCRPLLCLLGDEVHSSQCNVGLGPSRETWHFTRPTQFTCNVIRKLRSSSFFATSTFRYLDFNWE